MSTRPQPALQPIRRFLLRGLTFFGVLALGGWALGKLRGIHDLPSAWPEVAAKWTAALQAERPVNAVLLGSSVVRHHFDPVVLDSVTQPAGWRWHNLGISASFPPESYAVARALLEAPGAKDLELVVLDVLPLESPHLENAGALRRSACMDVPTWMDMMRVSSGDLAQQATWTLLGITHLLDGWRVNLGSNQLPNPDGPRGFLPLDTLEVRWDALRYTREQFLQDPTARLQQLADEAADFDYRMGGEVANPCVGWTCPQELIAWHLDQMHELNAIAHDRGIHLVYSFQKLWETNGCLYLAALAEFGPEHVIQLMGARDRIPLNRQAYWYDGAHLTAAGAERISRDLGQTLLKACAPNR